MQAVADGFVRYSIPAPRETGNPEGSSTRDRQRRGEISGAPAEWLAIAWCKKTAQEPGRPYLFLAVKAAMRRGRYTFSDECRDANLLHSAKKSVGSEVRPKTRGTGVEADGRRESEDCVVAKTSGNGVAPEAGRAKAVRVKMNARRDPCPIH